MKITNLNGNPDAGNAGFDHYLTHLIIRLIWKIAGNGYWDTWLKENDAYDRRFTRPYAEYSN